MINIKPNKRPRIKKNPYPSPLPEQIFASATQQMPHIRKRSPIKQNFSAYHKGKHKNIKGKRPEQTELVQLGTIVGMIRGNTSRTRPREQPEQWLDNEISFPSTPGCQLVDSPTILEALIERFLVRRIYVDGGSSFEVMYEHCFRNLRAETRAKLKKSKTPLVGFSREVSYPTGTINLNVTMGEPERLRTIPMEFAVVKSHSPYNVILGRTGLRSLGDVASTIHSMIKFPTANGIATVITKRETLHEYRRMEEAQGPAMEGRITLPQIQAPGSVGTTSHGKKEGRWQTDEAGEPDDTIQPPPSPPKKDTQTDEKVKGKDEHLEGLLESKPPEKVVIHDDYPDQTITIRGNLSVKCRSELIKILRKHANAFAWTPVDMTGIPRFIAGHELKTYPHIDPRVQRKRSIAPDRRKVVKDKVTEWLKDGIVRKVRYLTWVANPVLVKKPDDS
ncbi:hypothetical protein Tco_0769327 [Tanacetum coccineum]|uniref:Reverse transcriptase domain-containing protein n=1 Tax=Tanacetum coccineum TaxID=301880 RepID=A0ABQ4ZAC5_9ASTR